MFLQRAFRCAPTTTLWRGHFPGLLLCLGRINGHRAPLRHGGNSSKQHIIRDLVLWSQLELNGKVVRLPSLQWNLGRAHDRQHSAVREADDVEPRRVNLGLGLTSHVEGAHDHRVHHPTEDVCGVDCALRNLSSTRHEDEQDREQHNEALHCISVVCPDYAGRWDYKLSKTVNVTSIAYH